MPLSSLTTPRGRAALAVLGGLAWALIPVGVAAVPALLDVVALAPVLVAFGLLELHRRYGSTASTTGTAGTVVVGVGLAAAAVAGVANALYPDGVLKVLVVGVPVVTAGILLVVGSALLAYELWRLRAVPTPLAVAFAVALPASVAVNAVVAPALDAGIGLYGLAWAALGAHLYRTADGRPTVAEPRSPPVELPFGPQVGVAGLASLALALFGLAGFVPLGPVNTAAFVGMTPVLDALHLGIGVVGLVVAAFGGDHARWFNRIAGPVFLVLAAAQFAGLFHAVGLYAVHWTVVVLYLPLGVGLTAVGFGVDALRRSAGRAAVE